MRMGIRGAAAVLAACVALGACNRGSGSGSRGDGGRAATGDAEAQEDSARVTAKALQDSGVSVDTQKIDTGGAQTTHVDDN
ncbi:MAG TPA: hypothetical protein VF541_01915 [Longimicrobium sp.]|jgi:hypothetical protein